MTPVVRIDQYGFLPLGFAAEIGLRFPIRETDYQTRAEAGDGA